MDVIALTKGEAVWCSNLDEYRELREILHRYGYTWNGGQSLLEDHCQFPDRTFRYLRTTGTKKVCVGSGTSLNNLYEIARNHVDNFICFEQFCERMGVRTIILDMDQLANFL